MLDEKAKSLSIHETPRRSTPASRKQLEATLLNVKRPHLTLDKDAAVPQSDVMQKRRHIGQSDPVPKNASPREFMLT